MSAVNQVLKDCLSSSQVEVKFTKANGEERVMLCTTSPSLIPTESLPIDSGRAQNPDVTCVYDLVNGGWRSFRNESVIEWKQL